jgi:hypothetical protein
VYFAGVGNELKGRLVMVRIDQCNAFSLFGEMLEVLPVGSGAEALGRRREIELSSLEKSFETIDSSLVEHVEIAV